MRPFGLLLAACFCTVLLYDRLAGRCPAVLLAAASAPTDASQTSVRRETRLEKLQHYEVLLRLGAGERASLKSAEEYWRGVRDDAAGTLFVARLDKKLQPTWNRMKSSSFEVDQWRDKLPADKRDALIQEENERKKQLEQQWESFRQATQMLDSDTSKAVDKQIEEHKATKQYLEQKGFVEMLQHELDAAREALKQK